ncbi:hypothetical protein LguiA_007293 [Lonicera macranthoides]
MHQLIREMGQHIVRKNFPREPGKYSRLWDTSDIERVLTNSMGTENIEGILLNPQKQEYIIEMGTEAFRKMAKLRYLEIHNTRIPEGPDYLPDELRWIDWDEFPSNYLPTTFEANFLVRLRLCYSRLEQLWEGGKSLSFRKSLSQSWTSVFQSLSHLRKRQKTMRSLVLLPIWGLTSLTRLDLTDCNLREGAILGDLGSLFSLKELRLGGNNFNNLPSLNQLSQLVILELNRCEMLRELPELPLRLERLFANDCASLRVSAVQFGMCKLEYVWFQNCRKLLNYGECDTVANTLLRQMLQGTWRRSLSGTPENVILPGRAIPEWFCNHTFTEHSVSLKLPRNWYYNPKFKGYSFFVILEVRNKVKSCNFSDSDDEIDHRRKLRWSGLQHDGPITDVGVELSFTEPSHYHSIHKKAIHLRETNNITGMEHTIMGYPTLDIFEDCIDCCWYERGGIEVGIRLLSPDTVVVKDWGVRLVFKDDDDDT